MQSVSIHTQSQFVVKRAENNDTSGASHSLLDKLRRAVAEIPNVSWVTKILFFYRNLSSYCEFNFFAGHVQEEQAWIQRG